MMKVAEGQIHKMALLYERYKSELFAYYFSLSKDKELSEDLVVQVFEKMIKGRKKYKNKHFRGWMYSIARNSYFDYIKQTKSRKNRELEFQAQSAAPSVEEGFIQEENMEMLQKAINGLAPRQKEILVLTKLKEMKYKEVAELTGLSEGAVKTQVFRAIQSLKEKMNSITA